MNPTNEKRYRRSFWKIVNRDLELKYTLVAIWFVVIALLVGGLMTYQTIWKHLLMLPRNIQPEELLVIQMKILKLLGMEFVLVGVLVIVMAAIMQFRILHRISGPIYRIEKELRDLAQGKLPPRATQFRKKDLHWELAEAFNQVVEAIRSGKKFE